MTNLDATRYQLEDVQGRKLGEILVEQIEGALLVGKLVPGRDFNAVASLFVDFDEAAELQALSTIDQLDQRIAALKLHLLRTDGSPFLEIDDLQIGKDGNCSCRLHVDRPAGQRNGLLGSDQMKLPTL